MAKVFSGNKLIVLLFVAALVFAGACTSSNSSVQTNPNYNANLNSPTRTPEKYGNPSGTSESENKKPADMPVTIMQISMEVPAIEVNQPYSIYALVSNPSAKDVQYEWRVTSGKLAAVTEEDKTRLKKTVEDEIAKTGAAAATPAGAPTAQPEDLIGGEKNVDGKLIPADVNPNDALKTKGQGAAGSQEFKEGEPVPPPQIQALQNQTKRNEPGVSPSQKTPSGTKDADGATAVVGEGLVVTPPPGAGSEIATPKPEVASHKLDGVQFASAWVDNAFSVRYATLSSEEVQTEQETTEPAETAEGNDGDESSTTDAENETAPNDESVAAGETDDDATNSGGELVTEVEPSGDELPLDDPGYKELTPLPDSPLERDDSAGDKTGFTRHWPTPWEMKGKVQSDRGSELITDIQKQIETEIAKQQGDGAAQPSREPTVLTTSDPFVRWIPDTAESVTISLKVVNLKGIELTEPTVLDVEVMTPQPKIELAYEMPEDGLEPGDTLDVALKVKNIPDYRRSLIGVNFDLNNFDIAAVKLGDLFDKGSNNASLFYAQPDKSSGLVTVAIALEDMIRSVRGSGEAFVVEFEAKAPIPADISELGFSISKEANFRYIQDTSGDNQLPPVADGASLLQSKFVAPPQPESEATPAAEGTELGAGVAPDAPGAPGVAVGGAPVPDGATRGGAGGGSTPPPGIRVEPDNPGGVIPQAEALPPDDGSVPPPDGSTKQIPKPGDLPPGQTPMSSTG